MVKPRTVYICQVCGGSSPKWLGRCPECNSWNSFVEEVAQKNDNQPARGLSTGSEPQQLRTVYVEQEARYPTLISEFDRVLGGGIVPGSLVLVGGDPGIGKSTLLLQTAHQVSQHYGTVLYVSGEESAKQIKLRADRLGAIAERLFVLAETDIAVIERHVLAMQPLLVIIDSIQTIFKSELESAPGSVSQVRECTAHLMRLAKGHGIPIMIVGHVTKEGAIAGPRVLEHMVDTVLYFEGERHLSYRILRAVKNRFGSTNEIGVFAMEQQGLREINNPSEIFLAERKTATVGAVVAVTIEGTRPLLVELQALVSTTAFGTPRRTTTGVDYNRVAMIMAVLDKKVGLHLQSQDAYINITGGVKIDEPASDLAVAIAVASSFRNAPVDPYLAVAGEVGLTGEVRAVTQAEKRVREAAKLGFKRCIVPRSNFAGQQDLALDVPIEIIRVETVGEALETALRGGA